MLRGTNMATPFPPYKAGTVFPDLVQPQHQLLATQIYHSRNARFPDYKMHFLPPGTLFLSPCPAKASGSHLGVLFSIATSIILSHHKTRSLPSFLPPQLFTQPSRTEPLPFNICLRLSSLVSHIIHLYLQSLSEYQVPPRPSRKAAELNIITMLQ